MVNPEKTPLMPVPATHPTEDEITPASDEKPNDASKQGLDAVLDSLGESETSKRNSLFLSLIGIIIHVCGGALLLSYLEGWSYVDAIYFCVTTTTTVGYGDITPHTKWAKFFVIIYVVVSLLIISTLLANFVGALLEQQEELLLNTLNNQQQDPDSSSSIRPIPQTNRWTPKFVKRILLGLQLSDFYVLGFSAMYLVIILTAGVLSFHFFEGLSYLDSVYTTIISASTTGFGDYEPTKVISKIIITIWLIFSTIGLIKVIGDFTDASVKAKQRTITRRLVSAQMDLKTWTDMDQDNDGVVDKAEFVTELLIRMGKADRDECQALMRRFEEIDEDNSGFISVEEVKAQCS